MLLVFFSSTRRFTLLPSDVSSAIIALGETSLQVIMLSWEGNGGFHLKARLNKCGVQADRWTRWSLWKLISKGVPYVPQKIPDSLSVHTMKVIITPSCTEIVFSIPSISHARSFICLLPAQALRLWKLTPEEQSLNPDASVFQFLLHFLIIPAASLIWVKKKGGICT